MKVRDVEEFFGARPAVIAERELWTFTAVPFQAPELLADPTPAWEKLEAAEDAYVNSFGYAMENTAAGAGNDISYVLPLIAGSVKTEADNRHKGLNPIRKWLDLEPLVSDPEIADRFRVRLAEAIDEQEAKTTRQIAAIVGNTVRQEIRSQLQAEYMRPTGEIPQP